MLAATTDGKNGNVSNYYKKMRTIIIFLLLFKFGYSQNTLIIDFELCNNSENTNPVWNEYRLIKNDTLVTENKESLLKLPDGKYQIEYKTYFGWKKTKAFLLFDNIFFQVNLCIDKLGSDSLDYYNLGIESIKDGEKLIITNNYAGCFNEGGEKIIIERKKSNFILIYNEKIRKLRKREFDYLKEYEIELINLNTNELNVMCTAYSQNIIEYGNHKYEYSENCPKWNGFGILKNKLKLK